MPLFTRTKTSPATEPQSAPVGALDGWDDPGSTLYIPEPLRPFYAPHAAEPAHWTPYRVTDPSDEAQRAKRSAESARRDWARAQLSRDGHPAARAYADAHAAVNSGNPTGPLVVPLYVQRDYDEAVAEKMHEFTEHDSYVWTHAFRLREAERQRVDAEARAAQRQRVDAEHTCSFTGDVRPSVRPYVWDDDAQNLVPAPTNGNGSRTARGRAFRLSHNAHLRIVAKIANPDLPDDAAADWLDRNL
ncbi:hypothetical protein [Cellulosimicrobium sp. 22601]|uniref:hypothetical protein n=1 Tax=unclassified Cellulosimicrobium TaxID=2624466 RepID=UPI003F84F972